MTVLRSGIPDTLPGRSVNVCERGIAAVLSGELTPGEPVGLELHLPLVAVPLRARAQVRYSDRLRCGMEFVGLSPAHQAAIREWAELAKAPEESDDVSRAGGIIAGKEDGTASTSIPSEPDNPQSGPPSKPSPRRHRPPWTMLLIAAAVLATVFWWRWSRGWEELESGLTSHPLANSEKRAHVPADVMEKLLIHRVDPEYPAAARPGRLRGVVVLDVVVAPDGSVVQVRPLNGPEVFSRAAVEALRWWKFQPYRENGQAVEVETTVAVEFKNPEIGER